MARVAELVVGVGANSSALQRGLEDARNRIRRFARSADVDLGKLVRRTAVAATAAAAGFAAFGKAALDSADEIAKAARNTGLSATSYQRLSQSFELLGIDASQLNRAIPTLSRSIFDLGRGLSTQTDAFGKLGLTFRELRDLSPEQQFLRVRDRLAALESVTERQAVAQILLGRTGREMGTALSLSAEEFARVNTTLDRTGGLIDERLLASAEAANDSLAVLGTTIQAQFANALLEATGGLGDMESLTRALGGAVRGVTEALVSAARFAYEYRDALLVLAGGIAVAVAAAKTLAVLRTIVATLTAVFTPLVIKIGLVVGAVVGLVAIARVVTTQWESVRAVFVALGDVIASKMRELVAKVRLGFATMAIRVRNTFAEIVNTVVGAVNSAIAAVVGAINRAIVATNALTGLDLSTLDVPTIDIAIDVVDAETALAGLRADAQAAKQDYETATTELAGALGNLGERAVAQLRGDAEAIKGLIGDTLRSAVPDAGAAASDAAASPDSPRLTAAGEQAAAVVDATLQPVLDAIMSYSAAVGATDTERAEHQLRAAKVIQQLQAASDDRLVEAVNAVVVAGADVDVALRDLPPALQETALAAVKTIRELNAAGGSVAAPPASAALVEATRRLDGAFAAAAATTDDLLGLEVRRREALDALAAAAPAVTDAFLALQTGMETAPEAIEGLSTDDARALHSLVSSIPVALETEALARGPEAFAAVGHTVVEGLRGQLSESARTGDWSGFANNVLESVRSSLAQGFIDRFADFLNQQLSRLLGGAGGGGGGGLLGLLPSFQQGGVVPGRRGDEVLIRAHAGERVVPVDQAAGLTISQRTTIVGDVSRATRRENILMQRQAADSAFQIARENGAF